MYCYTVVQNLRCVYNEMLLWSNTSKEHPTFILTVAELTEQNLPRELEGELKEVHHQFALIEEHTLQLFQGKKQQKLQLTLVMKKFLVINQQFMELLKEVKNVGKADRVWQTLLEHINDEQKYMCNLVRNLLNQLLY